MRATWAFYARRVGWAFLIVLLVLTSNFLLFRLAPGDPAQQMSRVPGGGPQLEAQLRQQFGLDASVPEQFVSYLSQLLRGNLGVSFANQKPVTENLMSALSNTLPLMIAATLLAIVVGFIVGVFAALRRGRAHDHIAVALASVTYALPVQWLGLLLLVAFAGVLPAGGSEDVFALNPSPGEQLLSQLQHMILPVLTLTIVLFGQYVLIVRSAMLETLGEDYILTAKAKGLRHGAIVRRHAVRNAMLPTVTLIGLSLGALVGGSILVENVFSWPGIGQSIYQAVQQRDYPMLQGAFLVLTVSVVFFNLLADIAYTFLDPRVRP